MPQFRQLLWQIAGRRQALVTGVDEPDGPVCCAVLQVPAGGQISFRHRKNRLDLPRSATRRMPILHIAGKLGYGYNPPPPVPQLSRMTEQ